MYYYVYKITNLINGKIYVGKHKSEIHPLDNGYYGSGELIQRAVKKYGKENFSKVVLHYCSSLEEAAIIESKIVTKNFVSNPETYNAHEGGFGGWCHWNNGSKGHLEAAVRGGKLRGKKLNEFILQQKEQNTEWWKRYKKQILLNISWDNLSKSEILIRKKHLSEVQKGKSKNVGKNNSQYGRFWISNVITKEVKRVDSDDSVPNGWVKGKKGHQPEMGWVNNGTIEHLVLLHNKQEYLDNGFFSGRLKTSITFGNILQ
jgi:hypothetical protein